MFLNKSNLVEILAPPIIAVSGLLGLSKELDKAFNSRSIRGPAKLGMSLAIPAVDAWARWETEKASLTKQSPKSARLFENSGSFFPLQDETSSSQVNRFLHFSCFVYHPLLLTRLNVE